MTAASCSVERAFHHHSTDDLSLSQVRLENRLSSFLKQPMTAFILALPVCVMTLLYYVSKKDVAKSSIKVCVSCSVGHGDNR
jgi:hypothetical protein